MKLLIWRVILASCTDYYCVVSCHKSQPFCSPGDKVLVTTGFIEGDGLENARVSEVIDVINTGDVCSNLDKAPTQR